MWKAASLSCLVVLVSGWLVACSHTTPRKQSEVVLLNEQDGGEKKVPETDSDGSSDRREKSVEPALSEPVRDGGEPLSPDREPVPELYKEVRPEPTPEPVREQGEVCPAGIICVSSFPYRDNNTTSTSTSKRFSRYSCKTSADESGPERIYRVVVSKEGFLSTAVYAASGVDVDVHILKDLDENACLARGDKHAKADVKPGVYYIVVDTYVSKGVPKAGSYRVDIGLTIPSVGPCNMKTGLMPRVRDGGQTLKMPATGPIVQEAHLVTRKEPPPYPATSTDKLAAHYELSQKTTGFVMYRSQKWAPLEGGNFYGAGIGSPTLFPVLHESWYVNMYWTRSARPARGTRMLIRIPGTNRAVVVAAGYETGPGNLKHIGGTTEETHFYLGTKHLSTMTLGIAVDQTLPFGPRICK